MFETMMTVTKCVQIINNNEINVFSPICNAKNKILMPVMQSGKRFMPSIRSRNEKVDFLMKLRAQN